MDRVKQRSGKASPLMIAVGPKDKENLASPDVILKCKSSPSSGLKKKSFLKNNSKLPNKNIDMIKNQINNINSGQTTFKKQITAADLTTNGNPGDGYWEQLSESRRVALEATWKENVDLHSKIMELEYENTKLKAMLAESKNTIQIMTELLEEAESDDEADEEVENMNLNDTAPAEQTDSDDDSVDDASFNSV